MRNKNLYGIQIYTHWDDFPHWEDWNEYDSSTPYSIPVRFTSRKKAETWLAEKLEKEHQAELARWQAREEQRIQQEKEKEMNKALYEARKQALIDADLWLQEGETMIPLIFHGSHTTFRYHKPVRNDKNWRIVPEKEMDTSLSELCPGAQYILDGEQHYTTSIREGD